MDMVMDKYCRSRVALDRDEYMGPWDDTAVPFCAMSKCPDEECKKVELNAQKTGYVWKTIKTSKKKVFNEELQLEECVSNTNGTNIMCGDAAETVNTECPKENRKTCHKFDPTYRVWQSTEYDYFLNADGRCEYRPVGNRYGTVLTNPMSQDQCRTTPPVPLRTHECDDGTLLMQVYDEYGDPQYEDENGYEVEDANIDSQCTTCPVITSGCQYFDRDMSSRGGTWNCAKLKQMYGKSGEADQAICQMRFDASSSPIDKIAYDDTDSSPTSCIEQCCSLGSSCGARLGYYNIDNRGDIPTLNSDGTITCGRYQESEYQANVLERLDKRYIPRYKFAGSVMDHPDLGFNDHPTGIELVEYPLTPGGDIIDISSDTIDDVCTSECPAGSERVVGASGRCKMCDLNTEYFDGTAGGCQVHDGCTERDKKFNPFVVTTSRNEFDKFYNNTNNNTIEDSCEPCDVNTYLEARAEVGTAGALLSECKPCDSDVDREYYDKTTFTCTTCPLSAKLYTDVEGWRSCSNCPSAAPNSFVEYNEDPINKCVQTCDYGYFGGGPYSSGSRSYPTCIANCTTNEFYDPRTRTCEPCPEGTEQTDISHSNQTCTPCDVGSYRTSDMSIFEGCTRCPDYDYININGGSEKLLGKTVVSEGATAGATDKGSCYVECVTNRATKAYWSTATSAYTVETACGDGTVECGTTTTFAKEIDAEGTTALSTGAIVSDDVPDVYLPMGNDGCVPNGGTAIKWSDIEGDYSPSLGITMHTVNMGTKTLDMICPKHTSLYNTSNCVCDSSPGSDESNGFEVKLESETYTHPFGSLGYRCVHDCLDTDTDTTTPHVWLTDPTDPENRTCVKACKNGAYATKSGRLTPGDVCTGCPIVSSDVTLTAATSQYSNYFMGTGADSEINAYTQDPSISGSMPTITHCKVDRDVVDADDLCGTPPSGETWTIDVANGYGSPPNTFSYVNEVNYKAYDRSNCTVDCGSPYQIVQHNGVGAYQLSNVIDYDSNVSGHIAPELKHYTGAKKTFHQFKDSTKPVVSSVRGVHETYLPFQTSCPSDEFGDLRGGTMLNSDGTSTATNAISTYTTRREFTDDRDSDSKFYAEVNINPIYWCSDDYPNLSHAGPGESGPSVCCMVGTTAVWDDDGTPRCVDDAIAYTREAEGNNADPSVFVATEFTPPVAIDRHTNPVAMLTDTAPESTNKNDWHTAMITFTGTGSRTHHHVHGIDYDEITGTRVTSNQGVGWQRVNRKFPSTATNSAHKLYVCETENAPGALASGPYTMPVFRDGDVACCEYYEYANPVSGTDELPVDNLQFSIIDDQKICHRPYCSPNEDGCRSIMVDSIVHIDARSRDLPDRYLISAKEHDMSAHRGAFNDSYVLKPMYYDNTGTEQIAEIRAHQSFISGIGDRPIMLRLNATTVAGRKGWKLEYKELGSGSYMSSSHSWQTVNDGIDCKVYEYVEPNVYGRTWQTSHETTASTDNLNSIQLGKLKEDRKVFVVINDGVPKILTTNTCTSSPVTVAFSPLNNTPHNISQNKLVLASTENTRLVMGMQPMEDPKNTCTAASSQINDHYSDMLLEPTPSYFLYERECVVKCHQKDADGEDVYGVMLNNADKTVGCPTHDDSTVLLLNSDTANFISVPAEIDPSHDLDGKPVGYAVVCEQRTATLADWDSADSVDPFCVGFNPNSDIALQMTDMPVVTGVDARKYRCMNNASEIPITEFLANNIESDVVPIEDVSKRYFDSKICASNCPPSYTVTVNSTAETEQYGDGGGTLHHKVGTFTRDMYYTATGTCPNTSTTLANRVLNFDGDNNAKYIGLHSTTDVDADGRFRTEDNSPVDTATRVACTGGTGVVVSNSMGDMGCCMLESDTLWKDSQSIQHCCPSGRRYVETGGGTTGVCVEQMDGCGSDALIFADAASFTAITPQTSQRCYKPLKEYGELSTYIQREWYHAGANIYRIPFMIKKAAPGSTTTYWINLGGLDASSFDTYEFSDDSTLGRTFAYLEWIDDPTGGTAPNFVRLYSNDGVSVKVHLYQNIQGTSSPVLPVFEAVGMGGSMSLGYIHHDVTGTGSTNLKGTGDEVSVGAIVGGNWLQPINTVGSLGGNEMILNENKNVRIDGWCKDYRPNARTGTDEPLPVPTFFLKYNMELASNREVKLDGQECTYRCPSDCTTTTGSGMVVYRGTGADLADLAEDINDECGTRNCQSCIENGGTGVITSCCGTATCSSTTCVACDPSSMVSCGP